MTDHRSHPSHAGGANHAHGSAKNEPEAKGRLDTARDAASSAYDRARDTTRHALDTTRDSAREAARRTSEGIEANPLSVLVGGVALGVLFGAVLPRLEQEEKLLEPVGKRLREGADRAIAAAKDAGREQLEQRGLTRDAAGAQVRGLLESVLEAAAGAKAASGGSAGRSTDRNADAEAASTGQASE